MNLNHDLLSCIDEKALLEKAKNNDQDAIEKLITSNQRLVAKLANRFYLSGRSGDLELDDLMQLGNMGLYEAIKRFDLSKNVRFSTYATYWIRQFIMRHGSKDGNPYGITYIMSYVSMEVRSSIPKLMQTLGREPTPEEVAEHNNISIDELAEILDIQRHLVRLDSEVQNDKTYGDDELHIFIADPNWINPQDVVEESNTSDLVIDAINHLPEKWRKVIFMKYFHGITNAEIGRQMGVSNTRIQQIEKESFIRLKICLWKKLKTD